MNLNPVMWPLAGKILGLFAGVAVIAGGATAAVTAASSSEPGVSTFLCPFSSENMLLQWKTSGGYMDGTYQDAKLTGQGPGRTGVCQFRRP